MLLAAFFSVASAGDPVPLPAQQPLSVEPRRDLVFGDVIAGVPASVSRLDGQRSGMLEVRGERNAEVVFTFTLPPALLGVAAALLPIEFGADDGGFATVPSAASSVGFDPRAPITRRLSGSGRAYLWLGGTVRPAPTQASGPYEAPVTLTVAYTGN
jgi:hypothetical protein